MIRGKMVPLSVPERMNWIWSELARKWRSRVLPPNRELILDEGAPLSWVYRLRYRRPKELPYWIELALSPIIKS